MRFVFPLVLGLFSSVFSAASAGTWQGIDLDAIEPGTPAAEVPAAASIPPHPEWGDLTYFMKVNYRDGTNRVVSEIRPAYIKAWGEGCDGKVVQTTVVTPAMWRSLTYITNKPYMAFIHEAAGVTRQACPGFGQTVLVRLVNESTGEAVPFRMGTRLSDEEAARYMNTDPPAVPYKLPEAVLAGLNDRSAWAYAYEGMFSMRPQSWARSLSPRFGVLSLLQAYAEQVEAGDGSCRFASDGSATISTTRNGTPDGRLVVYLPENHVTAVRQAISGQSVWRDRLYLTYLEDARKVVARLGCADPRFAVLRENMVRWFMSEPALSDAAREALARGAVRAAPRGEKLYPVFSNDWRPFVDSCMVNWRQRTSTPSYGNLLVCTCAEYVTQIEGDPALYDLFIRNWNAAISASTRKTPRWIEMWNGRCTGNKDDAPRIAIDHADAY